MNREELFGQIIKKRSFLCVGLDTDYRKLPEHMKEELKLKKGETQDDNSKRVAEIILRFNQNIIDATACYAVAYKPNLAFYEAMSDFGIDVLRKTCVYIKEKYPEIFIIADAKRGDIGNTSELYAEAFLGKDTMFDAVTLAPYMGRDTVEPFLKYEGKWAVILALTSNPSATDFEMQELANGRKLYEQVLETSKTWGSTDNTMYVVGATRAEMLADVREIVPDHFLLVPGVGAQGGSLEEVAKYGMNDRCSLLVNSSRAIIYADDSENFAATAAEKAAEMQKQMDELLERYLPQPQRVAR